MGVMIDGKYLTEDEVDATDPSGAWQRSRSTIRNWITADGAAGPSGGGGFAAEAGRYHLYVAWNCPWAHRTLLARTFNRLEGLIPISVARPRRTDQGWVHDEAGDYTDPALGVRSLHQAYAASASNYTGRVTVPLLVDMHTGSAVSNESAEIVRMFGSAFSDLIGLADNLYPSDIADEIDAWNERIYRSVNNGVYRAGFASTQSAYEDAANEVFETLDAIDRHLADHRFLAGEQFTEADLRLFPTLARFDVAYCTTFKLNVRRIVDYPYLWPYARSIYQMPGVAQTVKFDIYKLGYFSPSPNRNPLGIVPIGPEIADWSEPVPAERAVA